MWTTGSAEHTPRLRANEEHAIKHEVHVQVSQRTGPHCRKREVCNRDERSERQARGITNEVKRRECGRPVDEERQRKRGSTCEGTRHLSDAKEVTAMMV